ncbi:MAG: hypothetical protein OEV64_09475 [Desulfobulbaceae bacterium]|nr:hypothetical protein [Desulfobulbaceae bacterium]
MIKHLLKRLLEHNNRILVVIQLLPYIYFSYLFEIELDKVIAADSFRYLWENGSTLAYYSNSSLTVRLLYSFAQNNLHLITQIQLALVAIAQIFLFNYLKNKSFVNNTAIALILFLLSLSHYSKWLVNYALSDSLFMSLNLIFLTANCQAGKDDSTRKKILLTCITIAYIFSRNPAPYIGSATLILIYFLKFFNQRIPVTGIITGLVIAIISISITTQLDSSTELNAANNIMLHIFPHKKKTLFFHEKYGMPLGPFTDTCARGTINSLCFNYQRIQTGTTFTRSYMVTTDDYRFADWIREKGMKSWQHYIFFEDTANTVKSFIQGYPIKFKAAFKSPPAQLLGIKYKTLPDFLDPFYLLQKFYVKTHLDNLFRLWALSVSRFRSFCSAPANGNFFSPP